MTTHRRAVRPWTMVLVVALLATMLVALRPSGTTMAAWSDEVSVQMPDLITGGIDMSVETGTASARVSVSGTAGVSWRPASTTVEAGGRALTGDQLVGTRIEYRLAGADGTCPRSGDARYLVAPTAGDGTSFAVSGDRVENGEQTLCVTVEPADKLRVSHGGQQLTVKTMLDGAAATWTTAAAWDTAYQMPAGPSISEFRCDRSWGVTTVDWNWINGVPVANWIVQVSDGGSWKPLLSVPAADRSVRLRALQFDAFTWEESEVQVVAVLPDGTQIPSGTAKILVTRGVLFGAVYCR